MDPLTIVDILKAVIGFIGEVPSLVATVQTAITLIETGTAPSSAEQAAIDQGLADAHAALQVS